MFSLFSLVQLLAKLASGIVLLFAAWMLSPSLMRKLVVDKAGNPVPPGPNVRYLFLKKYPELVLDAWVKQYGTLFSVWMGTQLFVVISDPHIARDLLVTNGAVFSSRKKYFLKSQTILRGRAITGSEYGDTWRQHRRIATGFLTPKVIQDHASILDYEARIFIRSLVQEGMDGKVPINPSHFTGRYALNNMLALSFGIRTDSVSDPLITKALELAMEFMALTGPWSNPIDFLEPLQWLPSKMRARGEKLHQDMLDVYGTMILRVKAHMDAGDHVPDCLVKTLIQTREKEKLDWEDMCMLSAVFTLGGVHSASGVLQWFLALISSHPEIQKKAHEELDRVVGQDRLPEVEDEAKLPYIRAVIKELERMHPPFWMATPHCTSEDFTYNDIFIPKQTVVILNCYTLHHNEVRYPDPHTFNPDRYLGDTLSSAESANLPDPMSRDHWSFGAGRRICPGIHVAEQEMWLAISRLLWAFEVCALPEEPVSLLEYEGLSGRTPLPFRLRFVPRQGHVGSIFRMEKEVSLWTI